ncbi:hypothetical protein DV451_003923 [Geotrichum candidum]|uniref:3-hydroxyisobutyryl-CoA hydrolase n=1 Tax=Geotrichum candidum TaxID=1173061 RepID=A0A9P5KT29_GEOCN|nr:hypothetical protein DV451_003923 [Geotrichum candidum]KAF5108601.1 hypothetical protein DV453_002194 [Geotrichum candidum]KAF5119453.1 hypothetical protein DV452_001681 [Geotrichum candidum]KAF5129169.1 hypothetical protein DV495_002522 [Geotrichum candidum]KAI9213731.1 hypothetical protein DS838_001339 [Geotrichum bryndzae]
MMFANRAALMKSSKPFLTSTRLNRSMYPVLARLNRPQKLNSLNTSMVDKITPRLIEWARSDLTRTVVIKGTGNKAFCAGGDVAALAKAISDNAETGPAVASKFFKDEYTLNHLIATYTKPYVALLNGITMGGGVGLSVHAPFRVATEKTLFAMPETDIGFFPDVGGSFFLPRLDGQIGTYLALTSDRLKGYDVVAAGIATHYVPEAVLPELEARLAEIISDNKIIPTDPFNLVNNVLEEFATDAPEGYEFSLSGKKREAIDSIFGQESVGDIISALEADGSEWALKTKDTILARSPVSVKVTFDALKRGKDLTITDALSKEYQLAKKFMSGGDFVEGVTAKLVNKPPTAPKWNPATLGEVTASSVSEFLNSADAADALKPVTEDNFVDYPHKFGLPTEKDIEDYITGNDGSDREFKVTKEEVLDHFQYLTRSKLGVTRKIEEVLARKTTPDATDSTLLDWKY